MADIILSPLVDAVIGNLVSAATDEIKILWGVNEEVNRLHRTLKAIQAVLEDAEEKQVTTNSVKNWLRELKEVAYDADDIVDEFAAEALRAKLEGSETSKIKQLRLDSSTSLVVKKGVGIPSLECIKDHRARFDKVKISHFGREGNSC